MLSFWERESFTKYEYIIIGGGIVGLSTACSIKEQQPDATVLVLERGIFPSGASTKNAGFACFGSITELLGDWQSMGKEQALELVKMRYEGLKKLRARLGDEGLGYLAQSGYELITEKEEYALAKMEEVNDWLLPYFGEMVFSENSTLAKQFGFGNRIKSVIVNPVEGQLDTGKMMRSLLKHAFKLGVDVLTGAMVTDIKESAEEIYVKVKNTVGEESINFKANKVAVCTNAFSKQFFPELDLQPGRGIVLITKPIEKMPFKGVFHLDEGYFYFRDVGNRVLLGGGRNLDVEGETTDTFDVNLHILAALQQLLTEQILPQTPYEVDMVWSGIMAFGADKRPVLKKLSDRLFAGVRLGGMGVAIGSEMGEQLAHLMTTSSNN